jgi:predicted AlkP superfamily phosphohydrolase/phosphomutase
MAERRARAISYLLREYPADLFLGVFTATDRVCHRFMNRAFLGEGEEKEAAWQALAEVYGRVDSAIGLLLDIAEDDDFVLVMSDHGFAARPWNLHVNQFLKDEGLLSLGVAGAMDRFGLTQRNVYRLLSRLHLEDKVGRLAPDWIRRLMPTGESRFGQFFVHELIEAGKLDWRHTRAVCIGNGIYLNTADRPHGIVPNREAEKVKARIREGLAGLRDPDGNGGGIIALDPHELYGEGELKNAPDLMLRGEDGWEVSDSLPGNGEVFTTCRYAGHSEQGIFMLRHPWAKVGPASEALHMEDLAPTILHLCGLPVPDEMDGRVRLDLFAPHTPPQREVARYDARPYPESSEKERIVNRVAELKRRGSI